MKAIIVNVITSDFVCNDGTKWLNGKVDIVIDFDIIHHKAGDTFITPWGDSVKFKHDCDEVIINKVI